ncbi:LuxR C-terminal-related transcriptional regulator [Paenibacillus sp. GbtcB18]|uniref:protein kinase domain-containing protein n=1 Tax=Paenibacillus sp. GbtcB18 TaxID=2824763 RepID=UPI001C2FBBBC|nr:LuxR C-terminal-related transcriptional regulator [Paenibacillus sp. GbtcB18]
MTFTLKGYRMTELIYDDPCFMICYAFSERSNRKVLLKVVKDGSRTLTENAKLLNEYKVASSLRMDGILTPTAAIVESGGTALEYEPVYGLTLRQHFEIRAVSLEEFLNIGIRLTSILQELHGKSVLHLNIRPDTILIQPATGNLYLTGFGYSSRTLQDAWEGGSIPLLESSPHYMSPEQTGRMSHGVDCRSDLYSLGVTLYELLASRLPYTAEDALGWSHAHMAREPAPLRGGTGAVPRELAAIVAKLLRKDPEDRYESASAVSADLQAFAGACMTAASSAAETGGEKRAGEPGAGPRGACLPGGKPDREARCAGDGPVRPEGPAGPAKPAGRGEPSASGAPGTAEETAAPRIGETQAASRAESGPPISIGAPANETDPNTSYSQALDLSAIIQSSQAFALGGDGRRIAARLMFLLLQTAGAERACLIAVRQAGRVCVLSAEFAEGTVTVTDAPVDVEADSRFDTEMIAACIRGRTPCFRSGKEYGSLLALPLMSGGEAAGCLYMENTRTKRAFAPERYAVLRTLAAQALFTAQRAPDLSLEGPSNKPVPAAGHSIETLTAREKEVLRLMAAGLSNREIAARLFITAATVKTHVKNIFHKMKVDRRIKAVTIAKFLGLLD